MTGAAGPMATAILQESEDGSRHTCGSTPSSSSSGSSMLYASQHPRPIRIKLTCSSHLRPSGALCVRVCADAPAYSTTLLSPNARTLTRKTSVSTPRRLGAGAFGEGGFMRATGVQGRCQRCVLVREQLPVPCSLFIHTRRGRRKNGLYSGSVRWGACLALSIPC
jgi:hypothetical protein